MLLKSCIAMAAVGACCVVSAAPAPADPTKVTVTDIEKALEAMPKDRPRLFIGKDGLKRLGDNAKFRDGKALADRIVYDATLMLDYKPCEREMEGRRLLMTSRRVLYRVNTLGMAYLLTGDKRFAKRAIAEMTAAANFSDWNPSHYLDVGEMTLALAVGYDWLYAEMTPEERKVISNAIIEKGLKTSLAGIHGWITGTNNWSPVCHNGMVAGALAIYEDNPKLAAEMIQRAVVNLPKSMEKSYAPEGAYPEGPMYWGYGTEFNVALLGLLNAAFGTDYGLSDLKGFSKTMDFISATTNTTVGQPFDYADCHLGGGIDFAQVWLIDRFNRLDCFTVFSRQSLDKMTGARPKSVEKGGNRMMPLAMFYLCDYPEKGAQKIPLSYFSGKDSLIPISVHRSDASNRATYLGMKAGMPAGPHGHMDGGSFLLEADGVRWAVDLGMENYNKQETAGIDLWNSAPGSGRWKLFRLGPQSHNILMIDGQEQQVRGDARIIEFRGENEGQTTLIDLTPLYAKQLKSGTRRGTLLPNREVEITDTLSGLKPGAKVRWQMCIQNVETSIAGNVLKLKKGKESMTVTVRKPSTVSWELTPAEKLMGATDSPNKGAEMATFEMTAPADGKLDIDVLFTPGSVNK
ncbi:MAG: heparinase II/III family protein [Victivallaceae bacterium]